MNTEFTSIPIIDISGISSESDVKIKKIAQAIGDAARNVGFFYVVGHGVETALFKQVNDLAKSFFSLTMKEKMDIYIGNSNNHRGYIPEGEEIFYGMTIDKKEAINVSVDELYDKCEKINPLIGPSQWPRIDGFKEVASEYYLKTYAIGKLIMKSLAISLDENAGLFDDLFECTPSVLRMLHYPVNNFEEDIPGIGSHSDYEFITLLYSESEGLEVMNSAGSWINIPPIPDAYVVNIGDMLEFMTNGHFVAASHRVRKVKKERYSFPFFLTVSYDTKIHQLHQFIETTSTKKYDYLVAGEHLYSQLIKTYKYLQNKARLGTIVTPVNSFDLSSFGHEARRLRRSIIS